MGGYNLPSFIRSPAALQLERNPLLPHIADYDLEVPMDLIYLHPYVREDPMWWPGGEPFADFSDPATGLSLMMGPTSWSPMAYEVKGGGSLPYKIMGIAKDAAGLPKAGCRALLYLSDGDVKVAETITDTLGIYAFEVGNITTQYYVKVFQISPPLAGISIRTLTGA